MSSLFFFFAFHRQALGIVCVGIIGNEFSYSYYQETANVFFLLMTTTFLIGTFILLLGCLLSLSTASVISKTIYVSTRK